MRSNVIYGVRLSSTGSGQSLLSYRLPFALRERFAQLHTSNVNPNLHLALKPLLSPCPPLLRYPVHLPTFTVHQKLASYAVSRSQHQSLNPGNLGLRFGGLDRRKGPSRRGSEVQNHPYGPIGRRIYTSGKDHESSSERRNQAGVESSGNHGSQKKPSLREGVASTMSHKHLVDRLPHMPHLQRPTKEELLAAATGFGLGSKSGSSGSPFAA